MPQPANTTLRLQPVVSCISDPKQVVEDLADKLDGRAGRATSWMQKLRGRSQVSTTPVGGVPTFMGRVCCYDHLRRFDGRPDLAIPFDTVCPGCQRVFRVTLGFVRPGR